MANMLCHDVLVRLSDGELTQMSNTQQCHMTFWHISKISVSAHLAAEVDLIDLS